ncbi:hypothetical protein [Nocardia jiangsuensis]|uniref:ABC-2 type transport system permease protein n=1 Tax=Nocardia jiangsuensis TaxID=1691563 RepID=A0ABV8E0Q3_9NOCA
MPDLDAMGFHRAVDDSVLQRDGQARLSAIATLYAAAAQRDSAIQAGIVGIYTIAFAFSGVLLTVVSNHSGDFHGFRIAMVPLPIWVLVSIALVAAKSAGANQTTMRYLQSRLDAIGGVDRPALDELARQDVSPAVIPVAGLALLAPAGVLVWLTVHCLVQAASAGWGWVFWAIFYVVFGILFVTATFSGRRRSAAPPR